MSPTGPGSSVTYRKTDPPGASQYEVLVEGRPVGLVGRFRMGAAQFGSTWMARTPGGRRSTQFPTRDAAAAWLMEQARE